MFLRGDLITPTLGGHTWFEKPALLYWMMIAAYRLFGVTETAARLGPAICGLLTTVAVFWTGRRVQQATPNEELCGLGAWSGLVVASMLGTIVFSRAASFDIVVTMTITWALSSFLILQIEPEHSRQRRLLLIFYAFVGLSLLAKGLVGIVIPLGVIGAYYLMRRELPSRRFLVSLAWGVPLALAVSAIWYGPVIARHGWPFINEFFIQHHFARYLSNKYRHPGPIYFYLVCLILLSLPWTLLLVDGLARVKSWHWRGVEAKDKLRVFAFAWVLAPLMFFSFSGSKLAGYILPILPAVSMIAGERLARFASSAQASRYAMRATGLLLAIVAIAGFVFAVRGGHLSPVEAAEIAGPMIIAGIVNLFFLERRNAAAVLVICVGLLFPSLVLNTRLVELTRTESVRDLVERANERGYSTAPVYGLGRMDRSTEFYAAGRVAYGSDGEPIIFENTPQVLNAAVGHGTILVFVPREYDQLLTLKSSGAEVIGDNGKFVLVAVSGR
jgi:4-amino-4-deoxy-L-arabinose transferase-like glycosyltransferase